MSQTGPLQLIAHDEADLQVISAAVQDAVLNVGDITFDATARNLTLACNRFRWEGADRSERVRCGLQFASVTGVHAKRIRQGAKGAVLSILAIAFETGDAPSGAIIVNFAGGADLRLNVECIDAVLADLSSPWPTPRRPGH